MDYYAFGSQMAGRIFNGSNYRYGFNGKENDNEVKGSGNQQDYGMRIYDQRLGKFLSIDPLTRSYSMLTPYQFASNSPVQAIDLDGMEGFVNTGIIGWGTDHVQGDVNGDYVMDASERKAWFCAMGAWAGVGAAVVVTAYTGGRAIIPITSFLSTPQGQQTAMEGASFVANMFADNPTEDVFPTPGPGGELALYFKSLFRAPIANVGKWLKFAGVESFNFIKGTNGTKTAIIGQGMDKVKKVAGGVKDALVFKPKEEVLEAWNALSKKYKDKGMRVPKEEVENSQIFKDNKAWIEEAKKQGYNIIDTGGGTSSDFYNMEKEVIYGKEK